MTGSARPERTRRVRAGLWRVAICLAVAGPACRSDPALPPKPLSVRVTMDEYRFSRVSTIAAGRVVFNFHNDGALRHGPAMIPLPNDVPPIAEQVRGTNRRSVAPVAGIAASPRGSTRPVAVDLAAGRYAIVCFIVDPDGRSHAVKGMATEFRVR